MQFGEKLSLSFRDTVLVKSFLTDGNVDFGESDTKSTPCKTYSIGNEVEGKNLVMTAKNCDDVVVIELIEQKN